MRRLVRHGIVAASLCGLAAASAVATVSGATPQITAVPVVVTTAPAASTSPRATPISIPSTAIGDRDVRPDRGEVRPLLDDEVVQARATTLAKQQKAIASRATALKKAVAKKATQKAEAERVRIASEKAAAEQAKIPYDANSSDPREIAKKTLSDMGYDSSDFSCFDNIIKRESTWRINARNASSGAYGLPQALPGSKMASAGSDWQTNPATQVTWAAGYMESRYGGICSAWSYWQGHHYY